MVAQALLVFLIIFSSISSGGVTHFASGVIEIAAAIMIFAWMARMCLRRQLLFVKTSLTTPLLLFFCLAVFQLIPLPLPMIRFFSPGINAYFQGCAASSYGPQCLSINPWMGSEQLLKVASYIGIFAVIVNGVQTRRQLDILLNVIIVLGVIISLLGIAQRYASADRFSWFVQGINPSASFGPFVNRNNFSGYVNMIIPLSLGYSLVRMPLSKRAVYLCCCAIMCMALFLSFSRAGIIVFGMGMCVFLFLSRVKGILRQKSFLLWVGLACALILTVFFLEARPILARLSTLYSRDNFLFLGHGYPWSDIIRMWMDFPVFGTGLGTFSGVSALYKTTPAQSFFTYAHNDALQLLSETGVLGLGIGVLFVYRFFRSVMGEWMKRHSSYAICLSLGGLTSVFVTILYSFLDFNLHIPSNAIMFFSIMGLVYRLAYSRFKDDRSILG